MGCIKQTRKRTVMGTWTHVRRKTTGNSIYVHEKRLRPLWWGKGIYMEQPFPN